MKSEGSRTQTLAPTNRNIILRLCRMDESPSLMELVVRPENIENAIKKVKKNKGALGIDSMKVSELLVHFLQYFSQITKKLLGREK
ncbi:hypothetical protein QL049_02795 [Staphylococcus pseudintermedius]|uniref:hypothetical protein n=1 Tax=Staphylococcus pseudintermedius TaxID=283734 RepID=UPI00283A8C7B|nr:hypothetical protein [Staphylococcus pseudintermedius]WMV87231.1 hypothetical protein QL049_02795 [Staphylococcus pseudintermedius]